MYVDDMHFILQLMLHVPSSSKKRCALGLDFKLSSNPVLSNNRPRVCVYTKASHPYTNNEARIDLQKHSHNPSPWDFSHRNLTMHNEKNVEWAETAAMSYVYLAPNGLGNRVGAGLTC